MSPPALHLHYREFGDRGDPPLLMLHGLFGASGNWMGVVKRLQSDYRLILPDLRNHGRSPHHAQMDYHVMAEDLCALMDSLSLESANLLGHSMGGKAAMWLALTRPERVDRLVVADIAPVGYPSRFDAILQGMEQLPLAEIADRESADRWLARYVTDQGVRQYLLQNLLKQPDGWQWRVNLPALSSASALLSDFPSVEGLSFPGEVLFLYGERSDYVKTGYRKVIDQLFPLARMRMLPGAGHWLYAEQPEAFSKAVKAFLK